MRSEPCHAISLPAARNPAVRATCKQPSHLHGAEAYLCAPCSACNSPLPWPLAITLRRAPAMISRVQYPAYIWPTEPHEHSIADSQCVSPRAWQQRQRNSVQCCQGMLAWNAQTTRGRSGHLAPSTRPRHSHHKAAPNTSQARCPPEATTTQSPNLATPPPPAI